MALFDIPFLAGQGDNVSNALGASGAYYLGNEASNVAREGGELARGLANEAAGLAITESAFQPYTVTSNLANIGTTAEGGYNLNLSPEQQQIQNQLLGQSQQLFGQVGQVCRWSWWYTDCTVWWFSRTVCL